MKRFVIWTLLLLCAISVAAQQADSVKPGDNLVVEGIPPVPAAIAERAKQYMEFRSATISSWHPTRREMLISTRFADVAQIHQVKMPGGARTQLTFFPDRVGGAAYQPHRGDYFVFSKDVGGGEWFQYFRFDVASGAITLLTDGKSRNVSLTWSNRGDRIAYASTRRSRGDLDFYVMNPADKSTDKMLVQNQGGGWGIADWSPDDTKLLAVNGVSINESYLFIIDVATGAKTQITPPSETKIAYDPVGFSADGKGIYVITDKDSDFARLAYIDLATKKHTYLTPTAKWDVEGAQLSWDRKLIAFAMNENGVSVLRLWDIAANRERKLPQLPTGTIFGLRWHENNRDLAFAVSSATSPSDVHSVDVTTGKVERWTFSETGGLNAANFSTPELVRWKSFDGLEISGFLYKPDAKFTGKRPVIINIHGGPEGQSRPTFIGRNNYYLEEMGVAIILPNVRGSTGYGKTFSMMDNGFKREDTYKDIEALLDWIATRPDLDASKVLITGGSYGGHMTLAIATNYNERICCSIDIVGISNLRTFLENTEAYRRDLRRVEYGDERDPKMREFLERIAPMNKVKNINKPLFVIQGANDPRVPKSEADQMVKSVRDNGTPVWYLTANDEGHGFAKKKNQEFEFYSTILFIERFLTNGSTVAAK